MKRFLLEGWSTEEALVLASAAVERTEGLSRYFVTADDEILADDGFFVPTWGSRFHVDVRESNSGATVAVGCDSVGLLENRRPKLYLERFEEVFKELKANWTGSPPTDDETPGASPTLFPILTTSLPILLLRAAVVLTLTSLGTRAVLELLAGLA